MKHQWCSVPLSNQSWRGNIIAHDKWDCKIIESVKWKGPQAQSKLLLKKQD